MARNYYQYDTNPRKIQTEEQMPRKNKTRKKSGLKVVKEMPKQQVEVSKEQKRKHVKLTMFAILAFTVLLAISYQNSQITVKFNEMQDQKKKLATIEKENEQLEINIENNLNIKNIEKEAKEKLGMEKLTNKQTVYVTLPKKDYVESASEKVVLKENKTWLQKMADWMFPNK
mgnify:FL=1